MARQPPCTAVAGRCGQEGGGGCCLRTPPRLPSLSQTGTAHHDQFTHASHIATSSSHQHYHHHIPCTLHSQASHARAAAAFTRSTPAPYVRKTSRPGAESHHANTATCTQPTPQHSTHTMASSKADAKKVRKHCPHARPAAAAPAAAACCVHLRYFGGGAERSGEQQHCPRSMSSHGAADCMCMHVCMCIDVCTMSLVRHVCRQQEP